MSNGAGKGDKYRPVDRKKYEENYDRIFGRWGFQVGDWVRIKDSPDDYNKMVVYGFTNNKVKIGNDNAEIFTEIYPSEIQKII
jgi:hypothetical protein